MGKDLLQDQYDYNHCIITAILSAASTVEYRAYTDYFIDSHTFPEPE